MSPVGALFDRTFQAFRARWRALVAIMALEMLGRYAILSLGALSVVVALVGSLDVAVLESLKERFSDIEFWAQNFVRLALIVTLFCGALAIFEAWIMTALFYAAERPTAGVGESLRQGVAHFVGFGWVLTLAGLLVTAGMFLFVIPGLILSVLYLLAPNAYFAEGRRGWSALERARACVSGRFMDTMIRLGVAWTGFGVLAVVLGRFHLPIAGDLFTLVGFPWLVIYQSELYRELSAATPGPP